MYIYMEQRPLGAKSIVTAAIHYPACRGSEKKSEKNEIKEGEGKTRNEG